MILNNRYFLNDLESGEYYEVSKEHYEQYNRFIKEFWKNICILDEDKVKGILFFGSTVGEIENNKNFEELFYNPNKFNTIENLNIIWPDKFEQYENT